MAAEARGHSLQGAIVPRLLDLSQLNPGINVPLELVKPGSACYGIQLRMLSSNQAEPLVWIFGRNGGLQIRVRGQGDSFYFDRPINDGIFLGALPNAATNPGTKVPFPIGSWAEVLIVTQPGIRLPDLDPDPWRMAPVFAGPRKQASAAGQFATVLLFNAAGDPEILAKGKHVLITSDAAGEVNIGYYQGGAIGGEAVVNPQPLFIGGQAAGFSSHVPRCRISGSSPGVLLQTAGWKVFQIAIGQLLKVDLDDAEISMPVPVEAGGGITRHGIMVAGPQGVVNLSVSFEWKERAIAVP